MNESARMPSIRRPEALLIQGTFPNPANSSQEPPEIGRQSVKGLYRVSLRVLNPAHQMADNLLPELTKLIATSLNIPEEKAEGITEETTLESLDITSLELVEILMTLEEEYDLHIDVDAVEARDSLNTVGDLLELGKKHGLGQDSE